MTSPRLIATDIIHKVLIGHSLKEVLNDTFKKQSSDKAFIQAMCYGVCREYPTLKTLLSLLLKKPLKNKDKDIESLLLLGLYQLKEMQMPDYAVVTETVEVATLLKKVWAKSLINAVLRNFLRQRASLESLLVKQDTARFAHPEWLIERIKKDWPHEWMNILHENNQHPPLACRINSLVITREDYIKQLEKENLKAVIIPETENGILFESPLAVSELPGFLSGEISVQDGAAQLAAPLLDLTSDLRVLDACAAPGGKLTHLLQLEPHLKKIVALDKEKKRIDLIQENLNRLALKAECIASDAALTNEWWDGQLFDRILLDAPCSATGVIRRHPDIKILRQNEDILQLKKEQLRLLNALWPLLSPLGILLYCTCSILKDENQDVINDFLKMNSNAKEMSLSVSWGMPMSIGRQILPGMHHMDGFYYAKLLKTIT